MGVEINLLPEQKRNQSRFPLLLLLTGLLGLLLLVALISGISAVEQESEAAREELAAEEAETDRMQEEIDSYQDDETVELQGKIAELEEKIMPASRVVEEIVRVLPPDSTITLYDYEFPDQVTVEVLMTTVPDMAYYQQELENSGLVQLVEVDTVSGEEIIEEMEEDFWFEDYLPQYFTTIQVVLHPDAVRDLEEEAAEEEVQP